MERLEFSIWYDHFTGSVLQSHCWRPVDIRPWLDSLVVVALCHVTLPRGEDKPELLSGVVDFDDVGGGDEVDETLVAGLRAVVVGLLLDKTAVDWSAQVAFLLHISM